jgi:signal transduction histidine kinase
VNLDAATAGAIETAVYRIVQEAVTNAVKHAGAEDVAVAVREVDGAITVRVHDEGRGFDPAEPAHGYGLVGVRERVESLGGSLAIVSAPRAGTTLTVRLPTNSRRDDRARPRPG